MAIRQDVLERLLLAKTLLSRIRSHAVSEPDRHFLATQIITAHDAAELAIAAIADQTGKLPTGGGTFYLMSYFDSLGGLHPGRDVHGRGYFRNFNRVRTDIKHHGIFPDPKQWVRVGEAVYEYASQWCKEYLGLSLDDLDESALLQNPEVKGLFDEAKAALHAGKFKHCLETLGVALYTLFEDNAALRGMQVGKPRTDDAIKLTAFGVHANNFLALQEFLPTVYRTIDDKLVVKWSQETFGHPGNWRGEAARFCLDTFLDAALKIQNAEWIPGALHLHTVYEYRVTALKDGVQVWDTTSEGGFRGLFAEAEKKKPEVIKTLKKGETLRGSVLPVRRPDYLGSALAGRETGPIEKLLIHDARGEKLVGYVNRNDVAVTLVPREDEFVRKHFPDLPEIEWKPD